MNQIILQWWWLCLTRVHHSASQDLSQVTRLPCICSISDILSNTKSHSWDPSEGRMMAELLYDIRLHEWAVPSPLTNGDKCQRRSAAVHYTAALSSSFPPSALQRQNYFRPELRENLKRCEACTLEGEGGYRKVNKAETKTVLAYFYERHGKMSLPIYVLLSRGLLFYFLASWSARWVGEGGGMEGEAVLWGRGKMDLQNTRDNIRISS